MERSYYAVLCDGRGKVEEVGRYGSVAARDAVLGAYKDRGGAIVARVFVASATEARRNLSALLGCPARGLDLGQCGPLAAFDRDWTLDLSGAP